MKDRHCVICGKSFTPGSWNAKYCLDCKVDVIARGKYIYKKKKQK